MKFKMAQDSYVDNTFYKEGVTMDLPPDTKHVPGPHWEPLDDEAKTLCKKHGIAFTGFVPDSIDKMCAELNETMAREKIAGSPAAIGDAVVASLVKAGVVKSSKAASPEI